MIKPIPGHEGYFADTEGSIYSIWVNKGIHGLEKGKVLKKLKGSRNKSGHKSVSFGRNSKQMYVHRIIYEVFIGDIPKGMVIRHLNDVPEDNKLSNLAIGEQLDNVHDCIRNGNFKLPPTKLTEEKVREIRKIKSTEKISNVKIAEMFGVDRRTIDKVIKKETWKEVV